MKQRTLRPFPILLILVFGSLSVIAQDRVITRTEFLTYMKLSEAATKTSPYRKSVTFETGDSPDGPWKPYSSMIEEVVMPDRSHLIYKTGPPREFVRVGKSQYQREANGNWMLRAEEAEGWRVSPASEPIFKGPVVEYGISDHDGKEYVTVVKVISRPEKGTANYDTELLSYTFSFDAKGLLRQQTSIAFNGKDWVRNIENFEYDSSIRIEAPIK